MGKLLPSTTRTADARSTAAPARAPQHVELRKRALHQARRVAAPVGWLLDRQHSRRRKAAGKVMVARRCAPLLLPRDEQRAARWVDARVGRVEDIAEVELKWPRRALHVEAGRLVVKGADVVERRVARRVGRDTEEYAARVTTCAGSGRRLQRAPHQRARR
eukprot:363761-Chlamydomonas_euryale.AAC.26